MSIIKNFNDFRKTTESHNVKEPKPVEPKTHEPVERTDKVSEPMVKRGDKKGFKKPTIKPVAVKVDDVVKESVSNDVFKNIKFLNKLAIFNDTIKASEALLFLESAKVSKEKLWYFMMDRNENTVQVVKYNPEHGFMLNEFVHEIFKLYKKNDTVNKYITENIKISGGKEFVVISNLDPTLKNILKIDLAKLLSE